VTEYLHQLLKESSKKLANRNFKRRKKGFKRKFSGSKGSSWRANPLFHLGKHIRKGWVNILPAWFQQGHEVSVLAYWFILIGSLF
jgi:hypothetical protein